MVKLYFSYDGKLRDGYETKVPDLYECPSGEAEDVQGESVLEKVPNLIKFIENIYDSLKPEGLAIFTAPYYNSYQAWQDPRNIRGISQGSLNFADKKWREDNGCPDLASCDFEVTCNFAVDGVVAQRAEETKNFWLGRYNNVVQSIMFTLKKR